jgi:hypothetical protein
VGTNGEKLQAHIVNYADDFVILCHHKAAEAQAQMAKMMEKLKLQERYWPCWLSS